MGHPACPPVASMNHMSSDRRRRIATAARNRREIIAAQLSRRDMMQLGLLTAMVRIGNDAIGSWTACPALSPAEQIVRTVGWMDV